MEEVIIEQPIRVLYVKARSFPQGIMEAYQKLHALLPGVTGRKFYGISYKNKSGEIIYKAATEEQTPGEAEKYGCDIFTIKKGLYLSKTLYNWSSQEEVVPATFQELLTDNRLDPNGYCLEIYPNGQDIQCLVKLRDIDIDNNDELIE